MKKLITQNKLKFLRKKIANYLRIILCVVGYFAFLQQGLAAASWKSYESDLSQIELYLNNIKNLSAKFVQETSDGNIAEGKFFLSRPGKMRIEYETNPKILIAVNGAILSYFDVELDEISRLSTNTTPASFLTRPNISFNAKDVEITSVKKSANQIKVSVMKKNRKEAGEFSLIFATNPLRFSKMEVKNDLEQIISVTLSEIDFLSPIPDKIFVLKKADNF
jgi:outer membrane lipoprotein-sorting protein